MSTSRSAVRRVLALGAVATALVLMAAVPAMATNSTVTRQDCKNRTISVKGRRLSTAECLRHVGQGATLRGRGSLAHTGFEVWIVGLLGVSFVGGAFVLRRRTSARSLA